MRGVLLTQPESLGKPPTLMSQGQRSPPEGVLTAAHPFLWPVSQKPPPTSPSLVMEPIIHASALKHSKHFKWRLLNARFFSG